MSINAYGEPFKATESEITKWANKVCNSPFTSEELPYVNVWGRIEYGSYSEEFGWDSLTVADGEFELDDEDMDRLAKAIRNLRPDIEVNMPVVMESEVTE